MKTEIVWPDGKRFAFTIVDDTDRSNVHNVPPIYAFLSDLGFQTTKSVWPLYGKRVPKVGGSTCEESDYRKWVQRIQQQGFEIALHNVTYHSSPRWLVLRGLERFREFFGTYPEVHINHVGCSEAIYWGDARLTGVNKLIYNVVTRFRNHNAFFGHREESPFFWGDLCRDKIRYVRNFVFHDINTLKACPYMPYHDPLRPYVNYWFASSEGADVHSFNRTISEDNQDRLEEEGGACIMYTHFGKGFHENSQLHPVFERLMERMSLKGGWFVPVSRLLDYILDARGPWTLSTLDRFVLESRWLLSKSLDGSRR
jgi:hypothetical protein